MIRVLTVLLGTLLWVGPVAAADLDGTLKKIKNTKTITLGFRESSRPFSFVNDEGKPAGYAVDLCTRVAADVSKLLALPDLQMKWVKVTVDDRIAAVAKGAVDLECGSTTASLSRQEQVDFSLTTFLDGGSLLVTDASGIKGVAGLDGKRVAIVPGTTTEKRLTEAVQKVNVKPMILPVKDHAAGVVALDRGEADAYASDRVILVGVGRLSRSPEKLSLIGEFFSYEPHGLMLRRNDSAFRLAVNRTLAALYRSGDIVPIYEKWFGSMPTAGPLIGAMYLINGLPE